MNNFETFEHEADIGIRGFGATIPAAFEHAAQALYSVMVTMETIELKEERSVSVFASDIEQLFIEWLNALLSLSDIERMVFGKFSVTIEDGTLHGSAWGEALDRERHAPKVEVKAATYHMLKVGKRDGDYVAECVVDV